MDKIYVAGYCFDRKYETSLIYYAGFCHPSVLRIFFYENRSKAQEICMLSQIFPCKQKMNSTITIAYHNLSTFIFKKY